MKHGLSELYHRDNARLGHRRRLDEQSPSLSSSAAVAQFLFHRGKPMGVPGGSREPDEYGGIYILGIEHTSPTFLPDVIFSSMLLIPIMRNCNLVPLHSPSL
ncbi:hypothetical protein Tco_0994258 [Tanacetum coccineum]